MMRAKVALLHECEMSDYQAWRGLRPPAAAVRRRRVRKNSGSVATSTTSATMAAVGTPEVVAGCQKSAPVNRGRPGPSADRDAPVEDLRALVRSLTCRGTVSFDIQWIRWSCHSKPPGATDRLPARRRLRVGARGDRRAAVALLVQVVGGRARG